MASLFSAWRKSLTKVGAFEFHAKTMVEFNDQLLPNSGKAWFLTEPFKLPTLINDLELDQSFVLDQDKPGPACRVRNPQKTS